MKGIVSQFVLFFFLILLMWTGVSYVSQNMKYGSAREFYCSVIRQIEKSGFDEEVMAECRRKAGERGYQLLIRQYEENARDARVTLEYDYIFPVTQKRKRYTINGYAR